MSVGEYLQKKRRENTQSADKREQCISCLCNKCKENIGRVGREKGTCTGCITCIRIIDICPQGKRKVGYDGWTKK